MYSLLSSLLSTVKISSLAPTKSHFSVKAPQYFLNPLGNNLEKGFMWGKTGKE